MLENIKEDFNASQGGSNKKISLADLIVLGGCAAVKAAARKAGHSVTVPFRPGRMDATQDQMDVESFAVLEPKAGAFRNFLKKRYSIRSEHLKVDKAQLLTLAFPELVVLVGGMRVLGTNYKGSKHDVFTSNPGVLTNDFFVNLLDMGIEWRPMSDERELFEGYDRKTGELKWTGTHVDLVFGSNSQLRAVAEVHASDDAGKKFVSDFVKAWTKVMELDRFDLS